MYSQDPLTYFSEHTCRQVSRQLCVAGVDWKAVLAPGKGPPISLSTLTPLIISLSSQIIFFNINEVKTCRSLKTFNNLSTLSEKDLISSSARPVSSNDLAIIHFSPALSHRWPSSVLLFLFRMVFPWQSSFLSFNSEIKYHHLRKTFLDPVNLKLDTLISSHCPQQYLSHPAALGSVCNNF